MLSKTNGTAARISSHYSLTLYTHCASHSFNLAVVALFEEVSVRNMIGVVNRLSVFFFAHPKRQKKLEEAIHSTQPESKVTKLKDLCRTRWIECIDAFDRVKCWHSSLQILHRPKGSRGVLSCGSPKHFFTQERGPHLVHEVEN